MEYADSDHVEEASPAGFITGTGTGSGTGSSHGSHYSQRFDFDKNLWLVTLTRTTSPQIIFVVLAVFTEVGWQQE